MLPHVSTAEVGLLACWCPVPDTTISPLMQGQAAVAARYELNKAAHAADAPKHDYITFKGTDMSNFKKGDRVVRTGPNFSGVLQGSTYIVDHQVSNTLYLEGFSAGYTADRFELANVTKPVPPWPFRGTHKGTFSGSQINLQNLPKTEGAYNPNVGHTPDGGGLQQHSIGGPFPFVLVGIENPTGLEPGTYWYVQDKAGDRCTIHIKSCERAGKVAAHLSTTYPGGINTHTTRKTPPLSASEGYIKPLPPTITIELNREAAEFLSLLVAHTGGNVALTNDLLSAFADKLGYTYEKAKERFDVSFQAYGTELDCGSRERGSIIVKSKVAA